jgi:saccharopine dehydrogenase-like NADP-dependent oxidoreductase
MKAAVLGCGKIGAYALRDLYVHGGMDEIRLAAHHLDSARALAAELPPGGARVQPREVDVTDHAALLEMLSGCDVAVNCVGPNYRFEVAVALASIEVGVHLVDLNDDYQTTERMHELDGAARAADVCIVLGLGASPGINNVLVRAAANQLDRVDEIHTAWVMTATDPGGHALACHLLHSLSGAALTVQDGQLVRVESFVDGGERLAFPEPVGEVEVFHVGHPEPLTLRRAFPEARVVDDKATFVPAEVNGWIRELGRFAREAEGPVKVDGRDVPPMDYAASRLLERCASVEVPREGALRVCLEGSRGGKRRRVLFSSAGLLGHGTGIPAAVGATMLARGVIEARGVRAPEECIEPNDFLYELFSRRQVATLHGWVED